MRSDHIFTPSEMADYREQANEKGISLPADPSESFDALKRLALEGVLRSTLEE